VYSLLSYGRYSSAVYSLLSYGRYSSAVYGLRTSAGHDLLDLGRVDVALLSYVLDVDVAPVLAYLYLADLCLYSSLDASLLATADLRHRLRQSRDSSGQYHGQHSR
jgi:hypothetical protein